MVGIATGLFISAFESAIEAKLILPTRILSNLIFSTLITLCITNSLYLFGRFWRSKRSPAWHFLLVFYCYNLLGMLVGIELSYLAVDFIFHVPFHIFGNFTDYQYSFFVFAIVGTVLYFHSLRQAKMSEKLHEKELALAKVKQLMTHAELQALQSKINPHFLYNSLNSIAGLIHEDADKAEEMTLKLSRLFRHSINANQENMASVTEEIEMVSTYLDIEKMRFGNRLDFVLEVGLLTKNERIPRFLIQPLVENALKHGLNGMAGEGKLKISINRDRKNIIIGVADNGKPFPSELNLGYGLQSTYDKLALLYGENYQVQIVNAPEKQVRIFIPLME
jgi:sensor histidine kinase YesM